MLSDWLYLSLNMGEFEVSQTTEGGVSVSTSPSPYDVPEAARTNIDKNHNRLSIEFQYIGKEPVMVKPEQAGISFRLGKNSGRLYGIDLELNKINATEVNAITGLITQTLSGLADTCNRPARSNNYSMVMRAVNSEKDTLLASLTELKASA
jgi:hypothetical protein